MVAFNMLWKLSVVVAFGLSTTVTSTDVAQEQLTQDTLDGGFFCENGDIATESQEVVEGDNTDVEEQIETPEQPMYSVDSHLLPETESVSSLREELPSDMDKEVLKDCEEPLEPAGQRRIKKIFSLYTLDWYLLSEQVSRTALRRSLPSYLADKVPEDCNEPIDPEVEERIRKYLPLYTVEWYLYRLPGNRAALRSSLPKDLAAKVPFNYRRSVDPAVEELIRKYFSLCAVDWYLLPLPENRASLRYTLPKYLAAMVPEDCDTLIEPKLEKRIRKFFSLSEKEQQKIRLSKCNGSN
ncbi:SmORF protein [Babesia bovis T2Bo]|uniref:SmORF n=1 Tax=Babesia bovis TaxID=5865 RepID=A7AQB1_BABBO|nr:SmORF protein [Babesia bovis T2Bo]EDO08745.1 SmORF protein [Babesia bovis T2Bo]|eukprot:XP_001612313.1 SmORF [Babesia bovis]